MEWVQILIGMHVLSKPREIRADPMFARHLFGTPVGRGQTGLVLQ